METRRWFSFDRLSFPRRRSRLKGAARDQLIFSIGRRWSRGLTFRSAQIPEMLDQAASCEGICEICRVITKWRGRRTKLGVRKIPLCGLVIPE